MPAWTRADALHVYTVVLGMMADGGSGREKSIRSVKGWWVNWMRLGGGRGEGFVVRRSGDVGKAGQVKGEVEGTARGEVDVDKYFEGVAAA